MFKCPLQQFVADIAALMIGRHEKLREKPKVAAHPAPREAEDFVRFFRNPQAIGIVVQAKTIENWADARLPLTQSRDVG